MLRSPYASARVTRLLRDHDAWGHVSREGRPRERIPETREEFRSPRDEGESLDRALPVRFESLRLERNGAGGEGPGEERSRSSRDVQEERPATSTPVGSDREQRRKRSPEGISGIRDVHQPPLASRREASPDAAPATGAAASTVDLTPPPPSLPPSPSLPPLLLQLSGSSVSVASLPLGQGKPASTLDDASAVSLPTSSPSPSPISSLSSSSQRSERSRSPRPKRSASLISRESGADDMAGPAVGRPGRERGRPGSKGGLTKAAKVSSPSREETTPSQKIEECASP